ncbi:uracil-DNA glycosylase [Paenibacillus sp. MZ04-78.2]|uniref:uracil-DNA glycosylase n=1 Tax=Paenibacillus sp. MZ04-78.2 TaxID=2962034 RepID=UPI0020B6A66B|nr:uracil-DNA glycosylase [Paenibacillus sp. MZ04-78.2]MCP3775895.1 uracil-DNA glycosylase [Paenibacillus sp. MZ04-78.2]
MTDNDPITLPEEAAPLYAASCRLCELANQRTRVIWGEGNPEGRVIMLLDNPGAREDREGRTFVCGTRATLQLGAAEAGLDMNDVYVTYVLKCRPIRKYDKEAARNSCRAHLLSQLEQKRPKLMICLGNVAVQAFFQDPEVEVKRLRGSWYDIDGLPTTVSYHPLAVRRRPGLMRLFVEDLRRVVVRSVETGTAAGGSRPEEGS